MKVSVFDTYVRKADSSIMHFDILVPEEATFEQVQAYGKNYLISKGLSDLNLISKECRFCHIEEAAPELRTQLQANGHAIIELHNC